MRARNLTRAIYRLKGFGNILTTIVAVAQAGLGSVWISVFANIFSVIAESEVSLLTIMMIAMQSVEAVALAAVSYVNFVEFHTFARN